MDLYIVRHGKAGKRVADPREDRMRALTNGGRKEVRDAARWFSRVAPSPGWIATSPLPRARETAEILAKKCGAEDIPEEWDELLPGYEARDAHSRIFSMPADSTGMVVGHEPQLSDLLSLLVSTGGHLRVTLAKGAIVRVAGVGQKSTPSGMLEWLVTPAILGKK